MKQQAFNPYYPGGSTYLMGNLIYLVTVYTYMAHTIRSEHLFYLKAILKKSENKIILA